MKKISYALGMSIAQTIDQSEVKEDLDFDELFKGIKDMLTKETDMTPQEANEVMEEYFKKKEEETKQINMERASVERQVGEDFLKDNAEKEGVVVLPSGLQYKVLTEGSGKKPKANSTVKVHYEGRLLSGKVFDSSYKRGEAITFGLDCVIAGWQEGLQHMATGSKFELYIPYNLAYGEMGIPNAIPGCATLIFVVELLEVL